ncbi:MAG: AMP-binding protein, partial [Candidatus Aminicenantes bacterium]
MTTKHFPAEYLNKPIENFKEKKFWLEKLPRSRVKSSFPPSLKKTTQNPPRWESEKFKFTGEIQAKLKKLSRQSDYMLFPILVTGLLLLLKKYTGANDIVVGAPLYKQESEMQLLNTILVLRNQIEENMSFKQLLLQVGQGIFEATENYNYPIEMLVEDLDLTTPGNIGCPLFDIAILLENIHERTYLQQVDVNMLFSFLSTGTAIEGQLVYNGFMYEKSMVKKIIHHFERLFQESLFNVEKKISEIDILTPGDKKQLLVQFNDTGEESPEKRTIHEIFAHQVEKAPDHTALVFADKKISYQALNQKANQLARLLRKKGVTPDSLIGIILDRSIEMMTALLGVLKAGGAYLPIDPEIPWSYMNAMLEDVQASLVISKKKQAQQYSYTSLQNLQVVNSLPRRTAPRPAITNLDALPLTDRSLVNYERYNQYIGMAAVKNSIALQTSRGCPYRCLYCHKIWPKKSVARSAENIFSEVKLYHDMGIKRFLIVDDIFNLNIKTSSKFFELIIKNGLDVQFFYPNGLRGDVLSKEYIDLMVEAGSISISLALETASPRLQKRLKKNLDLEKFRENIEYIAKKHP